MSDNRFPKGWSEEKVRGILAHYEEQTEDDALAEDAAGIESSETVMNVPHDLVPNVRELIAKHQTCRPAFYLAIGLGTFIARG